MIKMDIILLCKICPRVLVIQELQLDVLVNQELNVIAILTLTHVAVMSAVYVAVIHVVRVYAIQEVAFVNQETAGLPALIIVLSIAIAITGPHLVNVI